MSDTPTERDDARPEQGNGAQARAAEAAAVRRRWITLAEVLTVIAVSISALTLWNSWSERRDSEQTRKAEAQQASSRAATLVLTAASTRDEVLTLKPASADQSVQSQTIAFPSALGVATASTTGEPRIEASWFEDALKKARDHAGMPDDSRGDERLPIAITTRFVSDGAPHEDTAIYDVGYSVAGRWLSGHRVTLRGLSLIGGTTASRAQAGIDARWRKLFPAVQGQSKK